MTTEKHAGLAFQRETFDSTLLAELTPLLLAHKDEIAHYPDIPLHVDATVYHAAEANGALRIYTIRDLDQPHAPLVGYAVFFVRANPHYADSVQAVQDVLYVAPERRGRTGAKLIRFADACLRAEGVQAVYHHVKVAHNFGPLLERMGYEAVDVIYAKRLDLTQDAD
jgi:GNAT superfamily N-acetyltransferase